MVVPPISIHVDPLLVSYYSMVDLLAVHIWILYDNGNNYYNMLHHTMLHNA